METCREDTGHASADVFDKEANATSPSADNTCLSTCPHLYQALSVYVTTLEMFAFALILPLLFLPCVYLWIIRRASAEAAAFSQFQERLEEEEAVLQNGALTAQEIIDSLEKVKLVRSNQDEIILLPLLSAANGDGALVDGGNTRECCICMSEFVVQRQGDIETGLSSYQNPPAPENIMVRTKCGHLFHGACLAGWIGGRWEPNRPQGDNNTPRRIARRTCCPLCREDLKPAIRSEL